MNQADQFVAALPGAPGALLRRQLRCVYGMIVLIKEHERRVLIVRIVRHKQIGGIADENPLGIKGMMLFKDPHHIPIKPRLEQFGFRPPGHLAQIILIARRLTVERILIVEPFTGQRHIPRFGMDRLMAHLGTKGLDHPSGTDHVGKGMKGMNPMKPHGQITGNVDPHGNIVLLASRGIRIGQLTQDVFPR